MGIDLELPSNEQDNLPISNKNAEIMDSEDGIGAQDEVVVSPIHSEHEDGTSDFNTEQCFTCSGDEEDKAALGTTIKKGGIFEPQNGLEFESKEAAYSFYREYARFVGFGITIKASRRSKRSGKFIDVKIACSRFGSKRESSTTVHPRPCIKTGCKAGLHIKRTSEEKWMINSFVKEHNHDVCPEDFYFTVRGRNKGSYAVECQKRGLQLALDERDVDIMLEHFICMQDDSPDFFYAIDFDSEKCARSVLWVDAKGKHDYSNFSDVVFFDNFYVQNKYIVPYVPIFGVNHHFQYILFGCALMGDDTTAAYVWLMRTWLRAVGGQAPRVIISDQDKVLNEAVANVFPDSHHCFCLWHILSRVPEKLGNVNNFVAKLNKCVYKSWTDEQFNRRWSKMVDKFGLKENEWINSLYEDLEKWAPTYMQENFLAGMSTAERSGSVSSFFDKYMHKQATFKEFIEQYKSFLKDRDEMEAEADIRTQSKQPALMSLSVFEKQMSTVYTDAIFKMFQIEVLGVVSCRLQKETEDIMNIIFRIDDFEARHHFFVTWNKRELDVCCSCHSFEYKGFLCKHAILVLQISGVSDIPSRYILKRWTRDAQSQQIICEISSKLRYRVQRFNNLCKRAIAMAEEGCLSHKAYVVALKVLEGALKHCVGVSNSVRNGFEPNSTSIPGFLKNGEESLCDNAAKSSKKRKMYKKGKVHIHERITMGLQDNCQQMMHTRGHTHDNSYIPRQDVQGMDQGARAVPVDSYCSSEQNVQGLKQLNAVSSIQEQHYVSNQQSLLELGQIHSLPAHVSQYDTQECMQLGQFGFREAMMQGCFDIQNSVPDVEPSGNTRFHASQ